jgi:hypothetical protein
MTAEAKNGVPKNAGTKLHGVWHLTEWTLASERGVEAFGMGEAPMGRLIITKGWLSLIIQQADWQRAERRTRPGPEEMLALSGSWQQTGRQVIVQIDMATQPNWIGKRVSFGVQHSVPGEPLALSLLTQDERWLGDAGQSGWTERLSFIRLADREGEPDRV